jgi:diguanylate cyclase (GGDEF)-like protein
MMNAQRRMDPVPRTPHLPFSAEEREVLSHSGAAVECSAGDVIFEAGEEGRSMYVVASGEVELVFPVGRSPKRLGPGECFGELAVLTPGHRRTATARAVESGELRVIDEAAFSGLVSSRPRFTLQLLQGISRYLLESEQALVQDLLQRNEELERALGYLRQTRQELEYQEILARTDGLTGLFNRRCLDAELPRFIERAEGTGQGLALVMLDLDGLKEVNDRHGHAAGDETLRHVSTMITAGVRRSDLACRLGGDEFSVVLDEISPGRARRLAVDLLSRVAATPVETAEGLRLPHASASLGGTMYRSGDDAAALMGRADRELYQAKRLGGLRLSWMGEIVEAGSD